LDTAGLMTEGGADKTAPGGGNGGLDRGKLMSPGGGCLGGMGTMGRGPRGRVPRTPGGNPGGGRGGIPRGGIPKIMIDKLWLPNLTEKRPILV
jgi:hypothetical protein